MAASGTWRSSAALESILQQLRGLGVDVSLEVTGTPERTTAASAGKTATNDSTKDLSARSSATAMASEVGGATSSHSTAKPKKSSSSGKTGSSTKSSSGKTDSSDSSGAMAALDKMSDAEFMNAIQSGKLDPSIKNDPAAMRAIQARMDAISQMNQLLTAMMQAMHQMEMAIIQNIRV
jgi:hypothetical protein